jgi:hypothetical protein
MVHIDKGAEGGAKPEKLLATGFLESFGQISPNGRFLAYYSFESGAPAVYIRTFPPGVRQWKVSPAEAGAVQQPRWSQDGKELFYVAGALGSLSLMASTVTEQPSRSRSGPELDIGPAKMLFPVRANGFHPMYGTFFYSVSKDSQLFLINYFDQTAEPVLNVVVDWTQSFADRK